MKSEQKCLLFIISKFIIAYFIFTHSKKPSIDIKAFISKW